MAERQRAGTGSEGKPRSVTPVPLPAGHVGALRARAGTLMPPLQRVQVFAIGAERSPDVSVELRRNLRQVRQSVERHAGPGLPGPEAAASPSLLRRRLQQAHEELARIEQESATVRRRPPQRRRRHPQRRPEPPCPRRTDRRRPRPQPAEPPPLGNGQLQPAEPPNITPPTCGSPLLNPAAGTSPTRSIGSRRPSGHYPANPTAPGSPNSTRASNDSSEQPSGEPAGHTPQWLDLGRSLPHSQQPNEAPDLGLEA